MKSWALCTFLVSAAALVACGGSSSGGSGGAGGGAGGSGTDTTSSGSSMSTTVTSSGSTSSGSMATSSSSGGGDACADGTDCSACADGQTCFDCNAAAHPMGAQLYGAVAQCVICTGCYTVCDGAGLNCPSAPPTTDACDNGTPGQTACGSCQQCAQMGTCKSDLTACQNSPDCVAFYQAIQACPQ